MEVKLADELDEVSYKPVCLKPGGVVKDFMGFGRRRLAFGSRKS